jgi:RNA polymerase subunit RPABC4/transcription elongation factor Spt4
MERHKGCCRICGEKDLVRNINLYYLGSEELTVCAMCEMNLVEHVRGMVLIAGIARKAGYKARKEVQEAKDLKGAIEAEGW